MSNKLEDRLDHDEKILFQARYSLAQAIERALGFAIVFFAAIWIVGRLFGDDSELYGELVFDALFSIGIAIQLRVAAVLATDRRVLFRKGLWRRNIVEIALSDISQVNYTPGIFGLGDKLDVRKFNSQIIHIILLPRLDDLRDTILTLKGQPVPPRTNRKIKNAYSLMVATTIGCGLLGIGAFGFVFVSMIDTVETMLGPSVVSLVLFFMILFIPLMMFALILGFVVGSILFLILARFHMSPAEMKELICMDDGSSHGPWMERLSQWCVRYLEGFVSFLYGQKIRCD